MPTPVLDQLEFNLFAPVEPTAPEPDDEPEDLSHSWVVAAEISVKERIAKIADFRGSFTTDGGTRVDALEVYCRACRRPYEDVADIDCEALIDNRHLIGGDQSVRAKRKAPAAPPPNATIIPGGRIQRRGLNAYVAGVSRPPR
ncbi:hypothetical protein ACIQ9R_35870 [Streptomyces sp. NPDC094447]|uniref:hypothetical protein n=1 Tax=Streptomyces sp. NPDC094447 TaxID=3366062 RepID=UPI003812275C